MKGFNTISFFFICFIWETNTHEKKTKKNKKTTTDKQDKINKQTHE